MPIYEYECGACGHKLEAVQKMSDEPLTICPECQKPNLQKLVSAAGFQLKGTGWYATDFKHKGKQDNKVSDNKNDSGSTSSSKDTADKS